MSATSRRVLVAFGVFALAWTIAPPSTPPLYDGLGFPDEPYRYINAPAGYQHTKQPTSAVTDQAWAPGTDRILSCRSAEQGPQFAAIVLMASVTAPPAAKTMQLRADPLAPTTEPADGQIWGNVYRLTVTTELGAATIHDTSDDSITLRAPTGPPPEPVIEFNSGTGWHQIQTDRVGNDTYNAPVSALGDYAIVVPGSHSTSHHAGIGAVRILLATVLALFGAAVLAVRIARGRGTRSAAPR